MRAAVCKAYGPPKSVVIEEVPRPVAGDGQVVVQVHAASVNYPDVLIMQDLYQVSAQPPFIPGSELAGVVTEVGPGVEGVAAGDRVFGGMFVGAFAEYVALPAAGVSKLADSVDFRAAAAFPVVFGTAYHALRSCVDLKPGETLAVLGAAGGVGLAAVMLGKHFGAKVIAAASSAEKLATCLECGADAGVDYKREDLKDRLRELTDSRGVDVVLDPVGGTYSEQALRATRWGGRFVTVGFASGEIPRIPLNLVLLKGVTVQGFEFRSFAQNAPEEFKRNTQEIHRLHAAGELRPHIGRIYPLADAGRALADVAERRANGKVIIDIAS